MGRYKISLDDLKAARAGAIIEARKVLSFNPVYLDTETTGTSPQSQVIEIGIMDSDGTPLIESLVKPLGVFIPQEATRVHGITNEMVAAAPAWPELHDRVQAIIRDRVVVIYNKEFDTRLLQQTAHANGLTLKFGMVNCAMLLYARFHGEWNDYRSSFAWQKLDLAMRQCNLTADAQTHRANDDNALTRKVLQHMAEQDEFQTL